MKAKKIFNRLMDAINSTVSEKEKYVNNPATDFTRNRKISMFNTIKAILGMQGSSLNKELYDFKTSYGIDLSASAFVQQRSKIKTSAFYDVFKNFNELYKDGKKFRGYRLLAVDGSDIDHYRNPDSDSFIRTKNSPNGFNQIHLNALYDICNNTFVDAVLQGKKVYNEHAALLEMCKRFNSKDKAIIVADRGYESFNNITYFIKNPQLDLVLRARCGKGGIREIAELPETELDVDLELEVSTTQTNEDKKHHRHYIPTVSKKGKELSPNTKTSRWDFESPYRLKFRVVRFPLITGEYETLITTLPRKQFSPEDIKKIYHDRWGIETSFRTLKYKVGVINLHCKKDALIKQEIYAALTMYNYCSRIANCIRVPQRSENMYGYQLNFTMAIRLCRIYFKFQKNNFAQLLEEISKYTEPIRPGRHDKRNLKPKRYISFVYRVSA